MPKKREGKYTEVNPYTRMHRKYLNNINMHSVFIDQIGSHALKYDERIFKEIEDKLTKKEKKKSNKHKIASEIYETIVKKHPLQAILFYRNTLISIVTTFDNLLASIFRHYYLNNTDKLSLDNKQISIMELKNLDNIKDAEKFLINREVEKILRDEGLQSKIEMLKGVFGVNFDKLKDFIFEIEKVIKIRNLIVHNSSSADNEFVTKFGNEKVKKGDDIKVDKEYVNKSLYLMYFFGSFLLQDIQLRFSKKEIDEGEFILNNTLHYLIKNNELRFSRSIYDFVNDNEAKIKDANKKRVVINYCISQKKQNKDSKHIEKILLTQDWSIKSDDFEMCKSALLNDHLNFYKYLKRLIRNKIIKKSQIEDWEIFSFYNSKKEFKTISSTVK